MEAIFEGFGPGKLILFGEHAVVHGEPAIATSLDRGVRATVALRDGAAQSPAGVALWDDALPGSPVALDPGSHRPLVFDAIAKALATFGLLPEQVRVEIHMQLPAGSGLGSSAAMATALARALAKACAVAPEEVSGRVHAAVAASEAVFHGTPSGIDQTAALGGGMFVFERTAHGPRIKPLRPARKLHIGICQAAPGASTAAMVSGVRQRLDAWPEVLGPVMGDIGRVAREAARLLGDPSLDGAALASLGGLMDINHGLLSALGVSSAALDAACHVARQHGALGAKLTGAGGGGCVVALLPDDPAPVLEAWGRHGWTCFDTFL